MITPRKGKIRTADIEIVEEPVTTGARGRLVISPDGKKIYFDTGSQLIEIGRAQEVISTLSQTQVSPGTEDTEWKSSISSLSDVLSRIRNMIVRLTGRSWGTVDKALPEYFSGTSGHSHSGVDGEGPQISWNNISGKPSTYPPSSHASTHAYGGSDAVSLDAGQISSGRFPMSRMPTGTSGYFLKAQGLDVDPTYAALTASDIPNLDASKITSGRFPMSRMPTGTSGYFLKTQGEGADPTFAPLTVQDIPNLDASKITSGRFPLERLPEGPINHVLIGQGENGNPTYSPLLPVYIPTAQIWDSTIPTSWTDVNVSSIVGSRPVLLFLRFLQNNSPEDAESICLRRKGDTGDRYYSDSGPSTVLLNNYPGYSNYGIITTNSSGIFQWRRYSGGGRVTVWIECYIPLTT